MGEAEEERIAVVQTGGDEAVNKDGGGVGGEGGTELMLRRWCSAGNGGCESGRRVCYRG